MKLFHKNNVSLNKPFIFNILGLGVVIVINGGQTIQFITPENYTDYWYVTYMDFYRWLKDYKQDCMNLIAMGALTNSSFNIFGQNTEGNVSYLLNAQASITF